MSGSTPCAGPELAGVIVALILRRFRVAVCGQVLRGWLDDLIADLAVLQRRSSAHPRVHDEEGKDYIPACKAVGLDRHRVGP